MRHSIHRDNVYVTDVREHCMFHFKVEVHFRLVARVGSRGSGIRKFNWPMQLTVSTNGDVFVADFFNNRVQILNCNLHYQRHLSHHSLRRPRDIKLTQDEVYILCNKYPSRYRDSCPCIKVFSYCGVLIRSLNTCKRNYCDINRPFFFCLDANSNLLFSDDSQIRIFSKEGTLLHTLGESGHGVGMFQDFGGIALTENRKLIVVSLKDNYRLQIFSMYK